MAATGTRRRKQPERHEPHPAGSPEAIRIVRGVIAQQQRLRETGDEIALVLALLKLERRDFDRPGRTGN